MKWPFDIVKWYEMLSSFACVRLMASWIWPVWTIPLNIYVKSLAPYTNIIWTTSCVTFSLFCLMVQKFQHTVLFYLQ